MMLIIGVTRLGNVDSGGDSNQDEYDAYLQAADSVKLVIHSKSKSGDDSRRLG